MPTTWRVRDRTTFVEMRRRGRRVRRGAIGVTWLPGPEEEPPKVAFAIGRPVGTAVVRNRVRRRLRAVMEEVGPELPPGTYLISVGPAVTDQSFDEMRSSLCTAITALRRTDTDVKPERR